MEEPCFCVFVFFRSCSVDFYSFFCIFCVIFISKTSELEWFMSLRKTLKYFFKLWNYFCLFLCFEFGILELGVAWVVLRIELEKNGNLATRSKNPLENSKFQNYNKLTLLSFNRSHFFILFILLFNSIALSIEELLAKLHKLQLYVK